MTAPRYGGGVHCSYKGEHSQRHLEEPRVNMTLSRAKLRRRDREEPGDQETKRQKGSITKMALIEIREVGRRAIQPNPWVEKFRVEPWLASQGDPLSGRDWGMLGEAHSQSLL